MMKLSLLQALVGTLTETHQSSVADQIAAAWVHDHGSVQYFRASANFVFAFRQEGQPRMLRFVHASERRADALHAEIAYLQHLAAHTVAVALPVESLSGRYIETISTLLGSFHAVAFERLAGQQYEIDDLSLGQFSAWGKALGKLHQAAQGYAQGGRPTVDDHLARVALDLPAREDAARRVLIHIQRQIAALPRSEQTFGLIHYDFEPDNLVWNDEHVGSIDFDDCAYHWFVADLALALRDLFDDKAENIDLDDERFQAFLRGYRTIRPISNDELLQLPLFLRLHNLVCFVKLLRAADARDEPETPEWVAALQAKLVRKAHSYRDSFAAYEE